MVCFFKPKGHYGVNVEKRREIVLLVSFVLQFFAWMITTFSLYDATNKLEECITKKSSDTTNFTKTIFTVCDVNKHDMAYIDKKGETVCVETIIR